MLLFVADYLDQYDYSPSIQELGSHFGLVSMRGVTNHLEALITKGFLCRAFGKARTYRLTDQGRAWIQEQRGTPEPICRHCRHYCVKAETGDTPQEIIGYCLRPIVNEQIIVYTFPMKNPPENDYRLRGDFGCRLFEAWTPAELIEFNSPLESESENNG